MAPSALALGFIAPTPVGRLGFALRGDTLLILAFDPSEHTLLEQLDKRFPGEPIAREGKNVDKLREAFKRYFKGDLGALDEIPVDAAGTDFQRSVWRALREIPAGETRSYRQIAERIGKPNAVRAVGLANGQNPIALAIACHRVIGSDGSLTGYGGGLPNKRWLLDHEGATPRDLFGRK